MGEKISLIDTACNQSAAVCAHAAKKYPQNLYMFDIQKVYWEGIRDAHKNGKKVVFFGGAAPVELIYAFDMVPFFLDTIPCRIASQEGVASRYIDEAEKYVPTGMCGLDKVELGAALLDEYGVKPDVFIYTSIPCDSSRIAHPAMASIWSDVPSISLDVPFRTDAAGFKYLADQYDEVIELLEEVSGHKLDWDKFEEVMGYSNEAWTYLQKISELRKLTPCPLPGRLLVLNEMITSLQGHPAMAEFMKTQYEMGKAIADKGFGAVKEEKHRVSWLQNMLWSDVGTIDWMEKKYGAVLIMDGFGFQETVLFDDMKDHDAVKIVMARRSMDVPMIHGAAGPAENYTNMIDNIMGEYNIDVSMFVGHVGCKHTWAAAKIVTDMIEDKYGLPTLTMDIDAIDGRYKSTEEIRATISEYMETIEAK
jgi:benzoyl-CoA reductase/2-hydroxyglutaryl-CoA dehydratase subunit BcrC/BadD/HgdB